MATPPTCLSVRFSGFFLWAATQRRLGAYQICLGSWSNPAWFRTVFTRSHQDMSPIPSGLGTKKNCGGQSKIPPYLVVDDFFPWENQDFLPKLSISTKSSKCWKKRNPQTSIFGQWNQCEISNPCWFLRVSPWFLRLMAPRHSGAVFTPIPSTRAPELGQAAKSQDSWNAHCSKWLMVDDDWWCLMHLISQDSNLIVGFVGQKSHFCSTKCHQTCLLAMVNVCECLHFECGSKLSAPEFRGFHGQPWSAIYGLDLNWGNFMVCWGWFFSSVSYLHLLIQTAHPKKTHPRLSRDRGRCQRISAPGRCSFGQDGDGDGSLLGRSGVAATGEKSS